MGGSRLGGEGTMGLTHSSFSTLGARVRRKAYWCPPERQDTQKRKKRKQGRGINCGGEEEDKEADCKKRRLWAMELVVPRALPFAASR